MSLEPAQFKTVQVPSFRSHDVVYVPKLEASFNEDLLAIAKACLAVLGRKQTYSVVHFSCVLHLCAIPIEIRDGMIVIF